MNTINIDDQSLDLNQKLEIDIPDWQPSTELKPYNLTTKLYLDIETLGLDPKVHRITMIGFRDHQNNNIIITDPNEKLMLTKAMNFFVKFNPYFLFTYNGASFDLPFIIERCRIHKVKCPFKVSDYVCVLRNTSIFGKPIEFKPVYAGYNCNVIDLYHEVHKDDFVKRSLTSYSLKQVVLQKGWRKEQRLELTYEEMVDCWEWGDTDTLREYLIYDLEDTELIADKLVPQTYYQMLFLPQLKPQKLATMGNGGKWNLVLKSFYPTFEPQADEPKKYQGGYTEGYYGLYQNVSKIDVSSLYPSIMLRYGVCTSKDTNHHMLGVLNYLLTERLILKELAKKGDVEADQQQGALKVLINSAYGALATVGINFNDYQAAALVTAYGRKIVKLMIDTCKANGAQIVEVDTDGVMFCCAKGENDRIFQAARAAMPEGIDIDHEWVAKAVYIPGKVKVYKRSGDIKVDGMRKNYIIWFENGKVKASGKYRKRDRCVLEKTFEIDYLTRYIESPELAEEFYQDLRQQLADQIYPVDNLKITRKIKITEKALLHLGNHNQVITYYQGKSQAVNDGPYCSIHYQALIEKIRHDLLMVVNRDLLYQTCDTQLTLC